MERSTLSPPDELDTETALGVAIEFAVTSGPAVSSWQPLASGRHHLGRGRHVSIRIDDPLIEPHHAVVDVDADGTFEVIQLTGVVPIRVRDSVVTLGSSVVEFRTRARGAVRSWSALSARSARNSWTKPTTTSRSTMHAMAIASLTSPSTPASTPATARSVSP